VAAFIRLLLDSVINQFVFCLRISISKQSHLTSVKIHCLFCLTMELQHNIKLSLLFQLFKVMSSDCFLSFSEFQGQHTWRSQTFSNHLAEKVSML